MKPQDAKVMFQESRLDVRGLSIRDYWRKHLPTEYRRMTRARRAEFFLGQQEAYHDMEKNLKACNLPPGGAEEILCEAFYPESEEDHAMREEEERPFEGE